MTFKEQVHEECLFFSHVTLFAHLYSQCVVFHICLFWARHDARCWGHSVRHGASPKGAYILTGESDMWAIWTRGSGDLVKVWQSFTPLVGGRKESVAQGVWLPREQGAGSPPEFLCYEVAL